MMLDQARAVNDVGNAICALWKNAAIAPFAGDIPLDGEWWSEPSHR
jgi:hypothetical protein